jgi:hypothetical protein
MWKKSSNLRAFSQGYALAQPLRKGLSNEDQADKRVDIELR